MGALDVVGDFWTLGLLRCAAFGFNRFGEFQSELGVASNILADRLGKLVEAGVMSRTPYRSNPPRHEYRLTARGRELVPVIVALKSWGDRHLEGEEPVGFVRHRGCSSAVSAAVLCPDCGGLPGVEELEVVPPAA